MQFYINFFLHIWPSVPEFPPEEMFTADESALEEDLSEEEEDSSPKKGQKRKAGKQPAAKSKVGILGTG